MEYQKITNLFDNKLSNQPSKFRTKNWVEINAESKELYSAKKQQCSGLLYVMMLMHAYLLKEQ